MVLGNGMREGRVGCECDDGRSSPPLSLSLSAPPRTTTRVLVRTSVCVRGVCAVKEKEKGGGRTGRARTRARPRGGRAGVVGAPSLTPTHAHAVSVGTPPPPFFIQTHMNTHAHTRADRKKGWRAGPGHPPHTHTSHKAAQALTPLSPVLKRAKAKKHPLPLALALAPHAPAGVPGAAQQGGRPQGRLDGGRRRRGRRKREGGEWGLQAVDPTPGSSFH